MLGKVYNINTSVSWDKNPHATYHGEVPKGKDRAKQKTTDSLTFSAAFNYLKSISWMIKDMRKFKNEKLLLLFNYGGFDFKTEIDLNTIDAFRGMIFEIERDTSHEANYFKAAITINVQINHLNLTKKFEPSHLPYLQEVFDKIDKLGLSSNTVSANNYQNDFLLGSYRNELLLEFRNILTGVSIFIEKFTGNGFQFGPPVQSGELIKVEKIKSETTL